MTHAFPPPSLLPKVRSKALLDACRHMPCTLRIASFIGLPCAPQETVVGCHLHTIGKGMSSKVSDLYVAAGCATCHDLYDRRHEGWKMLAEQYPAAVMERAMMGNHETLAMWLAMGLIHVEDGEVV